MSIFISIRPISREPATVATCPGGGAAVAPAVATPSAPPPPRHTLPPPPAPAPAPARPWPARDMAITSKSF